MTKELRKFCLTLDLKDDDELISSYIAHHQTVWPEVIESIKASGIQDMEIYILGNRLFMIMNVDESFSFENKNKMDESNEKVQEWENLMWKFQQALPWAKEGEKWMMLEKIFQLSNID